MLNKEKINANTVGTDAHSDPQTNKTIKFNCRGGRLCPPANKQNGITLIALIITIIVMLILVGVTINVVLNGGLFDKAKTAATETEKQSIYEQIVMGMQLDSGKIDVAETFTEAKETLSGYTVTQTSSGTNYIVLTVVGKNGTYTYTITNEKIVIGEEIPQEPSQDTPEIGQVNNQSGTALQLGDFITYNNETWVVFYNDEEKGLQIISQSAKPGIELFGKDGYNNAIPLLNAECEKYMTTGAEYARVGGTSPTFYIEGDKTETDELGMIKSIDNDVSANYEDFTSFSSLMQQRKNVSSGQSYCRC